MAMYIRTRNYQIHEFDWLKSILKVVKILPSRPVIFCSEKVAKLNCKIVDYYHLKIFSYRSD